MRLGSAISDEVFEGRYRPNLNSVTAFDISPDSRRFIRIQQAQPERPIIPYR